MKTKKLFTAKLLTLSLTLAFALICGGALTGCDLGGGGSSGDNHTHQYGEWTVISEKTCTKAGLEMRICGTDASHAEFKFIPAGHNYSDDPVICGSSVCLDCSAIAPAHADNDHDHYCDVCGDGPTSCVDANNDHKCDICGDHMTALCVDGDDDHHCDICDEKISDCENTDPEHKHDCDTCHEILTPCVDEDDDDECDICGEPMPTI